MTDHRIKLDAAQARPGDERRPGRAGRGAGQRRAGGAARTARPERLTVLEVLKLASDHLQKHGSDSAAPRRRGAARARARAAPARPLPAVRPAAVRGRARRATASSVARRAQGRAGRLPGRAQGVHGASTSRSRRRCWCPTPTPRCWCSARWRSRARRHGRCAWPTSAPAAAASRSRSRTTLRTSRSWATDISREALEVAARNVAKHGLGRARPPRVRRPDGRRSPASFDLVCANLPYVAAGVPPARRGASRSRRRRSTRTRAARRWSSRLLDEAPARLSPAAGCWPSSTRRSFQPVLDVGRPQLRRPPGPPRPRRSRAGARSVVLKPDSASAGLDAAPRSCIRGGGRDRVSDRHRLRPGRRAPTTRSRTQARLPDQGPAGRPAADPHGRGRVAARGLGPRRLAGRGDACGAGGRAR